MEKKLYYGQTRNEVLRKVHREHGDEFYILRVKKQSKKTFFGFERKSFEVLVGLPNSFNAQIV